LYNYNFWISKLDNLVSIVFERGRRGSCGVLSGFYFFFWRRCLHRLIHFVKTHHASYFFGTSIFCTLHFNKPIFRKNRMNTNFHSTIKLLSMYIFSSTNYCCPGLGDMIGDEYYWLLQKSWNQNCDARKFSYIFYCDPSHQNCESINSKTFYSLLTTKLDAIKLLQLRILLNYTMKRCLD
jgi:hypothetical protein